MLRRHQTPQIDILAGLLVAVAILLPLPVSAQLTPQQRLGKQIYQRGIGSTGRPVMALMSDSSLEVPAAVLTCSSCHGPDGRGKPEGGVVPSNITWPVLTKPYQQTHQGGRTHPPYHESSVRSAIGKGIDPGGNPLSSAMPRFRMADEDLDALIAYLKVLGHDHDPGLSETTIRIGTVLPAPGEMGGLGDEIRTVLRSYFEQINSQGGIYNRKLELQVMDAGRQPHLSLGQFLDRDQVFAMLAPFTGGAEKQVSDLLESREIPTVGPLTMSPAAGTPPHHHIFYVFPGVREQAVVLAELAMHQPSPVSAAIVYPKREELTGLPEVVQAAYRQRQLPPPIGLSYDPSQFAPAAVGRDLRARGVKTVFFLGAGEEQLAFVNAAEELGWSPQILIPGSLAGREIAGSGTRLADRILLAYPMLPANEDGVLLQSLVSASQTPAAPSRHLTVPIWALSAARILVEAVKACGRDLTREKLVTALEGLYEFDTGLGVQITYGPNRRIGALGAWVVSLRPGEKKFVPVSDWAPEAGPR